jgi:hypothetical protein
MAMSRVKCAVDELTPRERENGEYLLSCPGDSCPGTIDPSTAREHLHKQEKRVFDGKCKEFREHVVASKARAEAWAECHELLKYAEVEVDLDSLKRKRGCNEKETERALQRQLLNPNYDEGRPSRHEPKYRGAFMCPRCLTGPVTREACTDLAAHHGQRNASGVAINNACAHCGFFGRDSNEWRVWDGVLRIAGNAVGAGSSSDTAPAIAPDTDNAPPDTAQEATREVVDVTGDEPTVTEASNVAATNEEATRPAWFADVMSALYTVFEDGDYDTLVAAALASNGDVYAAIDRVM